MVKKPRISHLPDELAADIVRQLGAQGIDLDKLMAEEGCGERPVKVVCLSADLRESLVELGQAPRDQVLMVRVDKESIDLLDAWVETGAARSRSEAAALFLKEGLKVRASELRELSEALAQVQEARRVLREKATKVLGRAEPAADAEEDR